LAQPAPTATPAANSPTTAPHRNEMRRIAAIRPYQQRTTERENPAQQTIKTGRLISLLKQLEEGKSEALTAYLGAMARFFTITAFATFSPSRRQRPTATRVAGIRTWNEVWPVCNEGRKKVFRFSPPSLGHPARKDEQTQNANQEAKARLSADRLSRRLMSFDCSADRRRRPSRV